MKTGDSLLRRIDGAGICKIMSAPKRPPGVSTKKVKQPASKAVTTPKAHTLSAEYVDDSGSEDASEVEDVMTALSSTGKPVTPKPTATLSSQSTTKGKTASAAKPNPIATGIVDSPSSQSSSSCTSAGDSNDRSESGDDSEESTHGTTGTQEQTKKLSELEGASAGNTLTLLSRAQTPPRASQLHSSYTPPAGFEPGSIPLSSSAAADLLSPSSLKGKQIWHITVPGSIPVDSIKEVSMQSVEKGEAALSYKGADYGFVADVESQRVPKILLIPDQRNNNYRPATVAISQTLHLQRLVKLPNMSTVPHVSTDGIQTTFTTSRAFRKAVRSQPQGLKMRYLPFGVTEGRFGRIGSGSWTSEGSDDGEPQFQVPIGVSSSGKTKKRKHNARDGPDAGHQSPEERQLKRSRSEADHPHKLHGSPETSLMELDVHGDGVRQGSVDNPSEAIVADGTGQEPAKRSSEDMVKRNKEKRRRKREKAEGLESKGEPKPGHSG